MKQTCEANGIHEFSRTRGGWMKLVEGIDKSQKGAYSFIGDNFTKVGNFKSNLRNGLYLDQSTSVDDGDKVLTMNLFAIQDGDVTLLKSVPKASGWEIDLWDKADDYFHSSEEVTAMDIVNTIKEMTDNDDIISEVITLLNNQQAENNHYPFKNWYEVKSILSDIECTAMPFKFVENHISDVITEDTYIFKLDIAYRFKKHITAFCKLYWDVEITEETTIDFKNITTTTFKSPFFQNTLKTKESVYYARTIPNYTGYHNGIAVTIFYYEDNVLCIREFSYYFDTYKRNQIGNEFIPKQH